VSRPDGYLLPGTLDVDAIVAEVARGFRVTVDEIMGHERARHIVIARACAMAVIRQHTNWSWVAMGTYFGKQHTTVQYNVSRVIGDPEMSRSVAMVVEELSPPARLFAVEDTA